MKRFDLRRDGFALGILALLVVLLAAGLTGTSRVFGYGLVAFFGLFAGLGFVRRGDPVTWWPPAVVTAVLLLSFMGMFANYPIALAPGMGLNAYFAFTVVKQMGFTWQVALGAVFISGVIFVYMLFFADRGERAKTQALLMGSVTAGTPRNRSGLSPPQHTSLPAALTVTTCSSSTIVAQTTPRGSSGWWIAALSTAARPRRTIR